MRVNDAFPDWLTKGIFYFLQEFDVPWKDKNISSDLDIVYHGNHSGDKLASPLLIKMVEDNALSDVNAAKIAKSIYSLYQENWKRKWEIILSQYDPLENYRMSESEQTANQFTSNNDGTVGTTGTNSNNVSVYGFNSSESVNRDRESGDTQTTTTSENTNTGNSSENRTLTRYGNIGVTTSEQMAESQIALWQWNFFNEVFADVDAVMTLKIY